MVYIFNMGTLEAGKPVLAGLTMKYIKSLQQTLS